MISQNPCILTLFIECSMINYQDNQTKSHFAQYFSPTFSKYNLFKSYSQNSDWAICALLFFIITISIFFCYKNTKNMAINKTFYEKTSIFWQKMPIFG